MAITRDAITVASQSGNGSSTHTFSHTVTGSNTALFVFTNDPGNGITGVTYNGVAMSQMALKNGTGIGGTNYIYGMVGPATGTNNVVVTRSGTTGRITSGSVSYNGVSQSGLPDATNTNNANDAITVTTVANNAAAVLLGDSSNGGMTNGTNTTTLDNSFGGGQWAFYESVTLTISPAGAYSMTAASGGGTRSRLVVSFAPALSTVNANFLAFM